MLNKCFQKTLKIILSLGKRNVLKHRLMIPCLAFAFVCLIVSVYGNVFVSNIRPKANAICLLVLIITLNILLAIKKGKNQ